MLGLSAVCVCVSEREREREREREGGMCEVLEGCHDQRYISVLAPPCPECPTIVVGRPYVY